jgi:hypothetical protein
MSKKRKGSEITQGDGGKARKLRIDQGEQNDTASSSHGDDSPQTIQGGEEARGQPPAWADVSIHGIVAALTLTPRM